MCRAVIRAGKGGGALDSDVAHGSSRAAPGAHPGRPRDTQRRCCWLHVHAALPPPDGPQPGSRGVDAGGARHRAAGLEEARAHVQPSARAALPRGKDAISEHADKTLDIEHGAPIVGVSLGASRTFTLRSKARLKANTGPQSIQHIALPDSSVYMLGLETNRTFTHQIAADKNPPGNRRPDENAFGGERISITRAVSRAISSSDGRVFGQGAPHKSEAALEQAIAAGDAGAGRAPTDRTGPPAEARLRQAFHDENKHELGWEEGMARKRGLTFSVSSLPAFRGETHEQPHLFTSAHVCEIRLSCAERGESAASAGSGPRRRPRSQSRSRSQRAQLAMAQMLGQRRGADRTRPEWWALRTLLKSGGGARGGGRGTRDAAACCARGRSFAAVRAA